MKTIQGVILVPKELQIPELAFLADEDMLRAYQERINQYSERARKTLNIFTFQNGVIRGSNPFANVELAFSHLASPAQLGYAVKLNPNYFRGNYEDLALVLRTNGDSFELNDYNAGNLYKQLKERGITPSKQSPVMIPLRGLSLGEDKSSHYGLVHRLADETEIVQAPELSHKNHKRKFSVTDERGVPVFDEEGTRTFYARKDGLDGFCLVRYLDLLSYWSWDRILAYSYADGRVAVVSAEGTEKNLQDYIIKLQQERDNQIVTIKKKYERAEAILTSR